MLVYFVEDDKSISDIISKTLEKMGLKYHSFNNATSFLNTFNSLEPDLILLDIMLPDMSGIEILKKVREKNKDIPIIIVSALFDEMDKVNALDYGADDYITKPFGILELNSRIQARLRKVRRKQMLTLGDLTINVSNYKVFSNNEEIKLTNKEYDVLKFLIEHSDEVLSKEKIFLDVWDTSFMGETRALDMHIKSLRHKLKDVKSKVKIQTVYGVGYKTVIKHNDL